MKDVTLYEYEGDERLWLDPPPRTSTVEVPVVEGITVAEVERLQAAARERYWDELLAGTTAATKLNEARAEAANMAQGVERWRASYEAADKALIEARAEAARYREALERIDRESHWRTRDLRRSGKIAREALWGRR